MNNPSEQWLKLNSDYAILWQVLISILGAMSEENPELGPNLMADLEDFVDRIEAILPPGDPQTAAYRKSLEGFRGALKRSNLLPT